MNDTPARKLLEKVLKFFVEEKEIGILVPLHSVTKRFRVATGVHPLEIDRRSDGERKILKNILKFFRDEKFFGKKVPISNVKTIFRMATGYELSFLNYLSGKNDFEDGTDDIHTKKVQQNFQLNEDQKNIQTNEHQQRTQANEQQQSTQTNEHQQSIQTNEHQHSVKTNDHQQSTSSDVNSGSSNIIFVHPDMFSKIKTILQKRQVRTLKKLLKVVQEKFNFHTSIAILRGIIEKLGYRTKTYNNMEYILGNMKLKYDEKFTKGNFDYLTTCKIRDIIQRKEARTMTELLKVVGDKLELNVTSEILKEIVTKKLRYHIRTWCDVEYFMDDPMVAAIRSKYLRMMRNNDMLPDEEKRTVIYIGEAMFIPTDANECWEAKTERWAVAHAGGDNGFVEGAALVYRLKTNEFDSDIMDQNKFSGWVAVELLPNLPRNCTVVISNTAAHHCFDDNIPPPISATKDMMINWLRRNKIAYEWVMTKKELYYLVKTAYTPQVQGIDVLFNRFGHEVLRLPPFHDDLNPIEYIWELVRMRIAEMDSITAHPKDLYLEIIKKIGKDAWKNGIEHVNRLRQTLWEIEMKEDNQKLEYVIYDADNPQFESVNQEEVFEFLSNESYSSSIIDKDDNTVVEPSTSEPESTSVTNKVQIKVEPDEDIYIEEFIIGDDHIVIQETHEVDE